MAWIAFHFSRAFPASLPPRWRSHCSELAPYAGLYLVYVLTRGLAFDGDRRALANTDWVIYLERGIGRFEEQAIQNWALAHAQPLAVFLNWVYIVTYWPVILGLALYLYLARPLLYA